MRPAPLAQKDRTTQAQQGHAGKRPGTDRTVTQQVSTNAIQEPGIQGLQRASGQRHRRRPKFHEQQVMGNMSQWIEERLQLCRNHVPFPAAGQPGVWVIQVVVEHVPLAGKAHQQPGQRTGWQQPGQGAGATKFPGGQPRNAHRSVRLLEGPLRSRKNRCSRPPHSSARQGPANSMRWLWCEWVSTSNTDPAAPVLGSAAP